MREMAGYDEGEKGANKEDIVGLCEGGWLSEDRWFSWLGASRNREYPESLLTSSNNRFLTELWHMLQTHSSCLGATYNLRVGR